MTRPRFTIVTADTPWNKPEAYRPDCAELLRERIAARKPSFFSDLRDDFRDDFRDVLAEISASPISHFLVGLATFLGTVALLVVPTLVLR